MTDDAIARLTPTARVMARLGTDLDAVPVANATERTAPTWEARALAAEARLAAVAALCDRQERYVGEHSAVYITALRAALAGALS